MSIIILIVIEIWLLVFDGTKARVLTFVVRYRCDQYFQQENLYSR